MRCYSLQRATVMNKLLGKLDYYYPLYLERNEMFIVSLNYISSLEEIDKFVEEHIVYLNEQYSHGNFIVSGRKEPRTGGIILSALESKQELESILKSDPFYRERLAEFEIIEFIPTKSAPELNFLIDV